MAGTEHEEPEITAVEQVDAEASAPAGELAQAPGPAGARLAAAAQRRGRGAGPMLARQAAAMQRLAGNAATRRLLARYQEYRVMPRGASAPAVARWMVGRVQPAARRDVIGVFTATRLILFSAEPEPRQIDSFPRGAPAEINLWTGVWWHPRHDLFYNLTVDDEQHRDHWSGHILGQTEEALVGEILSRQFVAALPQPPGVLWLAYPAGDVSETDEPAPPEPHPPEPGPAHDGDWASAAARRAEALLNRGRPAGSRAPDAPDRVVPWTRDGRWWVNVWVGGDHRALEMREGEADESLADRMRRATAQTRREADPATSTRVEGGATGAPQMDNRPRPGELTFPPGTPIDPTGGRRANAPPFPARIISHGPEGQSGNQRSEHTVVGATVNFTMDLEYAAVTSGFWEEFGARWQTIAYQWELFDVSHVQLPTTPATGTRSTDAVANQIQAVEAALDASRPAAEQLELRRRLTVLEAELASGITRDMARDVGNMWEDTVADLESGWGLFPPYTALVAISDVVQLVGAPLTGGFSLLASPMSDKPIGFGTPGIYLLRCLAQPVITDEDIARIERQGLQPIIRPPSVAYLPVRVTEINQRASDVNDAELRALDQLRAEERAATNPSDTAEAHRRVQEAEAAMGENNLEAINRTIANARAELDRITAWRDAEHRGTLPEDRDPSLRIWHAMLEIGGVRTTELEDRLNATIRELQAFSGRVGSFGLGGTRGRVFRPRITLVSETDGRVYPIVANLVQETTAPGRPLAWKLIDVTSDDTKGEYRGTGSTHNAAINAAFERFRLDCDYGRGTIAVRLPLEQLRAATGEDILVPGRLVSQPGGGRRFLTRLQHLAIAAEVAALIISGPVGIAIGVVGGLAGAAVAVHDLAVRAQRGQLLTFEAGMDVIAVIGSLALMGGIGARVRQVATMSQRARQVGNYLHIVGVGLMYGQVVIVPMSLAYEIAGINQQEQREIERATQQGTAANVDRARYQARRLEALARAIKSGAVTVRMAQMASDPAAGWNPLRNRSAGSGEPDPGPGRTPGTTPDPARTTPQVDPNAPLRPMAALRYRLREIAGLLRRRGVSNAERQEVIDALRTPHRRSPGPLEGFLPQRALAENRQAVRNIRGRLRTSNPDVVVGMKRGGALLAEVLGAGDPELAAKVRPMDVDQPPPRPDGEPAPRKFDWPAMQRRFEALIAAGARKIAIVDYYMGGRTADELSNMLRQRMNEPGWAGVTVEVHWIRETFGIAEAEGPSGTTPRGVPRPGQRGAGRYTQPSTELVTLALGDDLTVALTDSQRALHVFDDGGNITRTIRPQTGQTTRSALVGLLNEPGAE